ASSAMAKPVGPVRLPKAQADSILAAYAKDRSDTEQGLRESPTSYLAAIARADFGDKPSLIVGSAPDCDLRVSDPEIRAHHLRVTVVGDSFEVAAVEDTVQFLAHGEPAH